MARTVSTTHIDDLIFQANGLEVEATQTVTVGLNGQWWQLDLNDENFDQLSRYLLRYMTAGRKPESPPEKNRKAPGSRSKSIKYDTRSRTYYADLRKWVLREKGKQYDVHQSPQKKRLKAEYDNYMKGITS